MGLRCSRVDHSPVLCGGLRPGLHLSVWRCTTSVMSNGKMSRIGCNSLWINSIRLVPVNAICLRDTMHHHPSKGGCTPTLCYPELFFWLWVPPLKWTLSSRSRLAIPLHQLLPVCTTTRKICIFPCTHEWHFSKYGSRRLHGQMRSDLAYAPVGQDCQ